MAAANATLQSNIACAIKKIYRKLPCIIFDKVTIIFYRNVKYIPIQYGVLKKKRKMHLNTGRTYNTLQITILLTLCLFIAELQNK